jgi:hypothetical protein
MQPPHLGLAHEGWNLLFLFYPYTLMGWQHTFIHEVVHRPSRPNEYSTPPSPPNLATTDVETGSNLIKH